MAYVKRILCLFLSFTAVFLLACSSNEGKPSEGSNLSEFLNSASTFNSEAQTEESDNFSEESYPDASSGNNSSDTSQAADSSDDYFTDESRLPEPPAEKGLIINEVIASNSKFYPIEGEYYDLIELKNNSEAPVSLSNYYLTDKAKELFLWNLPEVTLNPGELYVIAASGAGGEQANFKISSEGETIYLARSDGTVLDYVFAGAIPPDVSIGRYGEGYAYYESPTFGEENGEGKAAILDAPTASAESGLYDETLTVELSAQGNIYYTLDGSKPDSSSTEYTAPIEIKKSSTLRALAVRDGSISSSVSSFVYHINEPEYEFDVLQISMNASDFRGSNGIYTNYLQRWEKEANLTYIVDGKAAFSVDCGFKLVGDGSRVIKKKNFQVRFRGEYGTSSLKYRFFGEDGMSEQSALMLRSGSEDFNRALFRDEMLTEIIAENCDTLLVQHYVPVHLYINSEYFGIYFIKERINAEFAAHFLSCDEDDIDLIKTKNELESGSKEDWDALISYVNSHNLADDGYYNLVTEQVNIESIADWYIFRSYFGDRDSHNIRYFRANDGKWHASLFDLDWALSIKEGVLTNLVATKKNDNILIYGLLQNETFRTFFLERLAFYMNKCLNEEYMLAKIDEFEEEFKADIYYDREVWTGNPRSWSTYLRQLRDYIDDGSTRRTDTYLADIKRFFKLSDEEIDELFYSEK